MKKKTQRMIYRGISVGLILISLAFSVFRFTAVFTRLMQSFKDLGVSAAYYFLEIFGQGDRINVSVIEIPQGITSVLPIEWEEFKLLCSQFGHLLIDKANVGAYLSGCGKVLTNITQVVLTLLLPIVLLVFLVKRKYETPNNNYDADTKALSAFKRFENRFIVPVKKAVKLFWNYLKDSKAFSIIKLIWVYNLNIITIFIEIFAFIFYFSVSMSFAKLYTQLAKFAIDISVPVIFIPPIGWALIGYLIFDYVRKSIGNKMLHYYESINRLFLETYLGALFLVGKQRAKKTTIITDMALSQEQIYRDKAKERMTIRSKQFPHFPWINLENVFRISLRKHSIYTLANCRSFIKNMRSWHEQAMNGKIDKSQQKSIFRHLRKKYGYIWNDFLFGYDAERYGYTYNDNLTQINVFEAIENYIQVYFIYSSPTSLILGNYSIRTDLRWNDLGNFPEYDGDFFARKSDEITEISKYCHILDYDSVRLGKVYDENNPNKDGFEVGIISTMENAKERGNQNTNLIYKSSDDGCNPKNDGYEEDLKMRGHAATVDNYTFFRLLLDDQRPDSLGADNKDLCDVIQIKDASKVKLVMPFFAFDEALYLIASNFYDKIYYKFRHLRGDNTLFIYLLKKLYRPIFNHYTRINNQYSVYTAKLNIWDAMTENVLDGEGRYYISTKKTYSNRFATDGIKDFYNEKALRAPRGLNDFPMFKDVHMSIEEMEQCHSHFYSRITKVFRNRAAAPERKPVEGQKSEANGKVGAADSSLTQPRRRRKK